jgi:hypothetical protein
VINSSVPGDKGYDLYNMIPGEAPATVLRKRLSPSEGQGFAKG